MIDISGIWDGVSNFATNAFSWIGDNPEAANLIGGVAMGAAQGYMQDRQAKEQRAFEREMYDKRREDRMAKPGEIGEYGSHLNTIAGKGLLSSGMITGEGQ
ncbi:MAG: hypothetical protein ACQEUM_07340 [Pseudomonadota bacterium]